MKNKLQNLNDALNFKEPERVPFIIWNTAPFCTKMCGVKQEDFYLNSEVKLNVHIKLQEAFPEAILFPGPWPDFGTVLETSMFGSKTIWFKDQPPNSSHVINEHSDILKLRFNPADSLLPVMLQQYEYMWRNMDRKYVDECGYLDGIGFALGPLETSATLMSYTDFLMGLYDEPELTHQLLDMVTDGIIYSLKEQQKVNGPLKRIFICDHMSHQVSRELFEEFCFPYYKRIFDEFPKAVNLYHNEGNLLHIAHRIPYFGANIIHYGVDTAKLKEILRGKVTLMGNLDPIADMLNGSEDQVYEKALKCLIDGAEGGGLLLSTAGGMAPGTPVGNVKAALKAIEDFASK